MRTMYKGHDIECSVNEFKELFMNGKNTSIAPLEQRLFRLQTKKKATKNAPSQNQTRQHWTKTDLSVLTHAYSVNRNFGLGGRIKKRAMNKLMRKLNRLPKNIGAKATALGITKMNK